MEDLVQQLATLFLQRRERLVTVESCTGGLIASGITRVPGTSDWFECGLVTYSNASKHRLVGVRNETLERYGAVSEQTVIELAAGALKIADAQASLAVSGIAGPGGGSAEKPVGTVYFGWGRLQPDGSVKTRATTQLFQGNRQEIQDQAARFALQGLLEFLA